MEAGADVIELGMPYSDPLADGPVIHAAGTQALGAGANVAGVLEVARALAQSVPVVLMCYANMVMAPGAEAFVERLAKTGASGLIVPDLPLGGGRRRCARRARRTGWRSCRWSRRRPRPSGWRRSARSAQGFLYTVSVVGTTGERSALGERFAQIVARAKASTAAPVALGFGISTPEHARQAAEAGADGVIVGTRLVRAAGEARAIRRAPSARSWANWQRASRDDRDRSARIPPRMGLVLTVTAGLVVWVVLWALGAKGFDAFLLAGAIILVGASLKILSGYLPGRRS